MYYKCLGIYFYNNNKLIHADEAFEKAKANYLEYFHRRFTGTAEKAAEAFNAALLRENEELKNQNEILKAELIKERKAHEDTRSS